MTRSENAIAFWNRAAERYARKPIADEEAYRHKLAITQDCLRPDMNLLEFGCGTGSTALVHAPFVRSILATDLSQEMIETARRKADAASVHNVRFETVSIEALNAPPGSFDAVLGLSVLHLVEDLAGTLARVHALLRPGGLFFSNTVCVRDMGPLASFLVRALGASRLGPPVTSFGSTELLASMGKAGFEVVSTWRPAPRKALFVVCRKPGQE